MQGFAFYAFAILAVFLASVQPIIAKKIETSIPPFAFIAITMSILALSALTASLLFEKSFKLSQLQTPHIAYLILFGILNLFSFWFFLKAISGIPTSHYQIIGGVLAPIFTAICAFMFLNEPLATRFFLAIPVAFLALYIAIFR